jgi:hypothetical protein
VNVDPEVAALVGEVCSMVQWDVAGTSDVDWTKGTVVDTMTVEGGGVESPGAD